jgi:hypothetical protein
VTVDDPVAAVVIWMTVAFLLWLALSDVARRLRVPRPALVAASLSWIIARLFIWAISILLQQVDRWFMS